MDAPNPSATPTFASRTPLHIGAIALTVRDLGRLTAFYRDVLGLAELDQGKDGAILGAGGVPFVQLEHRPDAKPDDNRQAGLYHTAFLMPTRADLARWVLHVARNKVAITGASDHEVSEAIYLDDPEGNGVEVYADRPPATWTWSNGLVRMKTDRLDIEDLVRAAAGATDYDVAPGGLRVGHIHLRVGDVATAELFYRDAIGLAVTRGGRHGASFMSSGGYHHHIAGNVWHSAGAEARDQNRAGLSWLALEAADTDTFDRVGARLAQAGAKLTSISEGIEATDPWGTRVRITRA
jgi:catechol 2,3-dioxygenase